MSEHPDILRVAGRSWRERIARRLPFVTRRRLYEMERMCEDELTRWDIRYCGVLAELRSAKEEIARLKAGPGVQP